MDVEIKKFICISFICKILQRFSYTFVKNMSKNARVIGLHKIWSHLAIIDNITKFSLDIAHLIKLRFESQRFCGCQSSNGFYFLLCEGFESIATVQACVADSRLLLLLDKSKDLNREPREATSISSNFILLIKFCFSRFSSRVKYLREIKEKLNSS